MSGNSSVARRVFGHNVATEESLMTAEQAREYALGLGQRKFRVEGTLAGNSRFLYKPTAERIQRRVGGTIVDYRPAPPRKRLPAIGICAKCNAQDGQPCKTTFGKKRKPHKGRGA